MGKNYYTALYNYFQGRLHRMRIEKLMPKLLVSVFLKTCLKKSLPFCKLLCLFLIITLAARSSSPEDTTLVKIREGLNKLTVIEGNNKVYECHFKFMSRGRIVRNLPLIAKRQGDLALLTWDKYLGCLGPEIMFGVEKGTGEKEWLLRQSDRQNPSETFKIFLGNKSPAVYPLTGLGHAKPLLAVLDDPSFRATSTSVHPNGLIDLGFEMKIPDPQNSKFLDPMTGVMTVSPKHHFAIVKWEETTINSRVAFPIKITLVREFAGEPSDMYCKLIRYEILNGATGEVFDTETFEFLPPRKTLLDPAEFTPAYYTIPTPSDAPEDQPSRWRWWTTVGGICLVGSIGLGWFAKRLAAN